MICYRPTSGYRCHSQRNKNYEQSTLSDTNGLNGSMTSLLSFKMYKLDANEIACV